MSGRIDIRFWKIVRGMGGYTVSRGYKRELEAEVVVTQKVAREEQAKVSGCQPVMGIEVCREECSGMGGQGRSLEILERSMESVPAGSIRAVLGDAFVRSWHWLSGREDSISIRDADDCRMWKRRLPGRNPFGRIDSVTYANRCDQISKRVFTRAF
nr:hypothetical protein Iba_chr15aCG15490 [Ipomoea batatas]